MRAVLEDAGFYTGFAVFPVTGDQEEVGWCIRAFWFEKIERNLERDFKVNKKLQREGWTVLRFWESDIKKKVDEIAEFVKEVVEFKKQKIEEEKLLRKQQRNTQKQNLILNYLSSKNEEFPQELKKNAIKYTRQLLHQKYPEEEITLKIAEELLQYGTSTDKS